MINIKLIITFFLTTTIISSINKTHYHFHFEKTSPVHKTQNPTVGMVGSGCGVYERPNGKCTPPFRPDWIKQCNGRRVCSNGFCKGEAGCCEVKDGSTCCNVNENLEIPCRHSGKCEGFRYCDSGVCKGESGCSGFIDPEYLIGLRCNVKERCNGNYCKCENDWHCNGERYCN